MYNSIDILRNKWFMQVFFYFYWYIFIAKIMNQIATNCIYLPFMSFVCLHLCHDNSCFPIICCLFFSLYSCFAANKTLYCKLIFWLANGKVLWNRSKLSDNFALLTILIWQFLSRKQYYLHQLFNFLLKMSLC